MTAKIRPTINGTTKARKKAAAPLPPACLFPRVAHLALWQLRENIDAYLSARECMANAQERVATLDPVKDGAEIALIQAFGERAEMTADLAKTAVAELLFLAWGVAANYDEARGNEKTPSWTPIGVHISETDVVVWIKPGDVVAEVRHEAMWSELTVIALVDLKTDDEEEQLLTAPPCPLLRLHYSGPASVIPAGKPA